MDRLTSFFPTWSIGIRWLFAGNSAQSPRGIEALNPQPLPPGLHSHLI